MRSPPASHRSKTFVYDNAAWREQRRLHAWEECCAYDAGKRGMIKMRKIRWFAVLIFLLLFSTCNAFAEEVRQSRVNQVSVTYQMENRKWGFIDILTGYNS